MYNTISTILMIILICVSIAFFIAFALFIYIVIDSIRNDKMGDMISRKTYEQIKWERDVAIQQLQDLGYGLGEKPREGE